MTDRLTIRRPDDWHVHLRDGAMLTQVARHTARQFGRAIVMPNLTPPVTSVAAAEAYRQRILAAVGDGGGFTPLMTCYLTDGIEAAEIAAGMRRRLHRLQIVPAHATTNSAHGVTDIRALTDVLETMQRIGMPLLIHGEVTDKSVDIFDREAVFIERVLMPLIRDYPALKVVLEHITTAEAAAFVSEVDHPIAATITPQHILINRNAMFDGGLRPHAYCLPVLKREAHRLAVRRAATSGSPRFFLAPTARRTSSAQKSRAAVARASSTRPLRSRRICRPLTRTGRSTGSRLRVGTWPRFYGLPLNEGTVTLVRETVTVPERIGEGETSVVPFLAGDTVGWRFEG